MAVLVKELRLSLIWNKSFYKDTNLPRLADLERYKEAFEKARQSNGVSGPWWLPWIGDHRQHFWQFYLQPVAPANFEAVSAPDARAYFVPLRLPPSAQAVARDGTVATLEGFCYPHSVGVLATIYVRPPEPLPLAQMVDATITARNADFQFVWKDKTPATHGALQSLADKIVERVHALALDNPSAVGKPLPFPITIATVIDAEITADPPAASVATSTTTPSGSSQPPEAANKNLKPAGATGAEVTSEVMLGRALNALCALTQGWRSEKFEGFPDSLDPQRDQVAGIARGRASWLRRHFSDVEVKGRKTALGCYHRNLALATLQTSALTALLTRANDVLDDPKGRLLLLQRDDVVRAIDLLHKLESGDFSTYRTWALQHQIGFYADRLTKLSQKLGI